MQAKGFGARLGKASFASKLFASLTFRAALRALLATLRSHPKSKIALGQFMPGPVFRHSEMSLFVGRAEAVFPL